jgi:hypothetical protein
VTSYRKSNPAIVISDPIYPRVPSFGEIGRLLKIVIFVDYRGWLENGPKIDIFDFFDP